MIFATGFALFLVASIIGKALSTDVEFHFSKWSTINALVRLLGFILMAVSFGMLAFRQMP